MTRCFGGPFNRMVMKFKYCFIILLTLSGVAAIIIAFQIGPLTEDDAMLPVDHPLMIVQKILAERFSTTADQKEALRVNIIWGVKGLNRDDVGLWDPEDLGKLVWDDDFTISPPENQLALMDFCVDLRENSPVVKENEVNCWIEDMDRFVREDSNGELSLPIQNEQQFNTLLKKFIF